MSVCPVFQVFPDVTILFSDVVKFNEICIHITPMQVVDMLNEIYIVFDTLSEKHNVYKVGFRLSVSIYPSSNRSPLSLTLSFYLSLSCYHPISPVYPSIYRQTNPSIYPSARLPALPPACEPSVFLHVCLPAHLSACLSVWLAAVRLK